MSTASPGFTFNVSNLGSVRNGSFRWKPLTVFCGPNNTGKTWVTYALYFFFKNYYKTGCPFEGRFEESDGERSDLDKFNRRLSAALPLLFNTSRNRFSGARFEASDGNLKNETVEPEDNTPSVFLIPAERNGLHLFFRELSTRRTALLHHASRESIDITELLRDVMFSRYAIPIADYINWLNSLSERQRTRSPRFHSLAEWLKRNLAGGAYNLDARTGSIEFKPYQKKHDGVKTNALDLHVTSGTVKSLFGLWFYLEHQAREGDIVMIDEPELNIHPENQRKIARLLAKLVNAKIHVVISTHSDYIVREFNTLIMLDQDSDASLRIKHGFEEDEILNHEAIGAYLFDEHTIKPFNISPDDGIYATTFDNVIRELNASNDDIFYSLQEQKDHVVNDQNP